MKSLLWKELRENRLLLGLGILFLCAFRLLPFLTDFKVIEAVSLFMFLACGIFSMLIGATGFSQEIDRNTLSFIISKPVSRSMMWIAKLVSNLLIISILFTVATLLLLADLKLWMGNYSLLWLSIVFSSYTFSFSISTLFHKPLISAGIRISGASIISVFGYLFSLLLIRIYNLDVLMFKVILINFVIGLILLFCSFLLWRNYISRFNITRKPITICLGAVVLIIGIVYGWSYYSSVKELHGVYRQIERHGDSLTLESVIPPPIPEAKNAAIIYEKAFEVMEFTTKEKSIRIESCDCKNDLSEESISCMKRLIEKNKETLRYIREAASYDECRFPLKYETGPALLRPHFLQMVNCGQLLCIQALLQSEEGDVKEAIDTCKLGLKIGKHLFPEPLLVSQGVRIGIHSMVIKSLETIINQHPDYYEGYLELLEELYDYEGHDAFVRCLKGERISGVYIVNPVYKPVTQPWNIYRLFVYYLGRPILNKDFAFSLKYMNDVIYASESPYYEVIEKIKEFDDNIKMVPPYYVFTQIFCRHL